MYVTKQLWKQCRLCCLSAVYVSKASKSQRVSGSGFSSCIDVSALPPNQACTLELCAGIIDKDVSIEEIAREELMEEIGYDVPVSKLEKVVVGRSVTVHARHTAKSCHTISFLFCILFTDLNECIVYMVLSLTC